jgi:hypothetical protein
MNLLSNHNQRYPATPNPPGNPYVDALSCGGRLSVFARKEGLGTGGMPGFELFIKVALTSRQAIAYS